MGMSFFLMPARGTGENRVELEFHEEALRSGCPIVDQPGTNPAIMRRCAFPS